MEPRIFTVDELDRPTTSAETLDDIAGYYYAFGRLDQGHAPVAQQAVMSEPDAVGSAHLFGSMWMASQRAYRDPDGPGGYFPGIIAAWENFVATGGRSVRSSKVAD